MKASRKTSLPQNDSDLSVRSFPSKMDVQAARILIVDDEEPVVELITKVLNRRGFRLVEGITDSNSVIEACQKNEPDLILLDLNMPGKSGFEILDEIGALPTKYGPIPIVVLTGERGRHTRMQALAAGARDYIVKPFDFEVVARIRNLLEARLLSKELYWRNEQLESAVTSRTEVLQAAHRETLLRLARVSRFHLGEDETHFRRFARTVKALAASVLATVDHPHLVPQASLLRDVGYVSVPARLLQKPDGLEQDEWELIRKHPGVGAEILSNSTCNTLKLAEIIARSHHEHWNGEGYPDGLQGEDIPKVARLIGVCDAFDAMVSSRPYRAAMTEEAARDEILRHSGTQFDPDIVKVFSEKYSEIVSSRAESDQANL